MERKECAQSLDLYSQDAEDCQDMKKERVFPGK